MPYLVGDVVEDAKVLRATMETHKAELTAKGFKEARFTDFDSSLDAVLKKDASQKSAHAMLLQKTADQDSAVENGLKTITKIQNAAKSAFGRDKTRLKEFKVGTDKSKSVSQLTIDLEYFTGLCAKYHDELIENGMTEEDVAAVSTTYGTLVSSDALQENAKKVRNAATQTRDDALAALREQVFKVRKFAQAAFAGNKALLEEFKPIAKGRGKAGAKPRPPVPEPPPATLRK